MTARVLAVADSDSYLKWAAGLLDALPPGWTARTAVVRSPITPSADQIRAALNGTMTIEAEVLPARRLRRLLASYEPDVVLLACTGPVVEVLSGIILDRAGPRPVLVSGLPGISVPASERAWVFRSAADLFIVHSHREVDEFTGIARALGIRGTVGRARLPFLDPAPPRPLRDRVVFATQAKVPVALDERRRILLSLATLAGKRPDLRPVVKLRGRADEQQTHRELHHYELLWRDLVAEGKVRAGALTFDAGPMREHLAHAAGFVTVSSTAALEAIAARVPLLVLSDFGVNAEMINVVFEGSDCLGTLADLEVGAFRTPDRGWCAANYFHDPVDDDWTTHLSGLVAQARTGGLPAPTRLPYPGGARARRRARMRLEAPAAMEVISAVRQARQRAAGG
ncbi:DUF6716 putative glycosyltransferase [Actinomadura rudentiformis]|uniref:Uncharacterized protein n=1 Tax=Actinomadura rudentiformis TaxID=359158 RepID=A0A6H9YWC9_9ACTN|nr:DUF6716 putative glycosyltransferase [Actinomadura rudentiformis]KAB2351567.1 hypothetical protein F8566_04885 [Actinomadura rudentiformis]